MWQTLQLNNNKHFDTGDTNANEFGSTFAFFSRKTKPDKKCKRATKPTHRDTLYFVGHRTKIDRPRMRANA